MSGDGTRLMHSVDLGLGAARRAPEAGAPCAPLSVAPRLPPEAGVVDDQGRQQQAAGPPHGVMFGRPVLPVGLPFVELAEQQIAIGVCGA